MPLPEDMVDDEDFSYAPSRNFVFSLEQSLQKEAILYNRKTSDKWFFPVVGCWWLWMVYTICSILAQGDGRRISHGYDFQGRLCAVDEPNSPYVYWPTYPVSPYEIDIYSPICVEACPTFQDVVNNKHVLYPNKTINANFVNDEINLTVSVNYVEVLVYPTRLFSRQYCFPLETYSSKIILKTLHLNDSWMVLQRVFKSLQTGWPVLAAAVILVVLYSLIYILWLPRLTLLYLWINNFFAPLALTVTCMYFVLNIIIKTYSDSTSVATILDWIPVSRWFFCLSLLGVGVGSYFLLTFATTRKTAHQIVTLSQTTLECVLNMPSVFILPILGAVVYIATFFLGCTVLSELLSSPDTAPIPTFRSRFPKNLTYGIFSQFNFNLRKFYHCLILFFSLLWVSGIVQSLVQFCVSLIVSLWYFTIPDSCGSRNNVQGSVSGSLWIALRHRFATLHIASLAVSFSRIVQIISWSTETYIKNKQQCSTCFCCYNQVAYFCFSFLQNLLYRLELTLKFMNAGGLIECSFNGNNFFHNSYVAYSLLHKDYSITRNIEQIHLMNTWINTYAIAIVLSGIAFWTVSTISLFSDPFSAWFVDNPVGLAVATLLCTSAISHLFIMSFKHISTTLLYCYLKELQSESNALPLFAPDSLRALIEVAEAECRLSEIADENFTRGQSLLSLAAQDSTFLDRATRISNSKLSQNSSE